MDNLKASEEFVIGKHNIGRVDSDFKECFGNHFFAPRSLGSFQKIGEYMDNAAAIEEKLKPGKCTLGDVLAFLNNPPEGTKDGWFNIFLVGDYVVSAYWGSGYGVWRVDCWRRGRAWSDGYRVFSPGLDLKSSGSQPSGSLNAPASSGTFAKGVPDELLNDAIKMVKEAGYEVYKKM